MRRKPIVLTEHGETLVTLPSDDQGDDRHLSEWEDIPYNIGVHACCGGTITANNVSETHKALSCVACGLRIVIPRKINTYRG